MKKGKLQEGIARKNPTDDVREKEYKLYEKSSEVKVYHSEFKDRINNLSEYAKMMGGQKNGG